MDERTVKAWERYFYQAIEDWKKCRSLEVQLDIEKSVKAKLGVVGGFISQDLKEIIYSTMNV